MRWRIYTVGIFTALALSIVSGGAVLADPSKPAQMTYLDNGEVRIGMDLSLGGAVTFLSSKEHPGNIINSADLGRQIQMSHYSGPWPYTIGEKKPHPSWVGLGWNPIQTGDCYMNPSRVVEHRNDGKELYIKCIPMQWPLDNVPGDCLFETWTTLEARMVHMRFRCTNKRSDETFYRPCPQELPAVYTISRLWRLMSYTGEKPYTQDALTHIQNDWRKPWPWTRFVATEGWAALVDDDDWGLGVFKADGGEFHGGIHGDGRSEDPKHGSTAYVAPIHMENFDHHIVYEHRTELMVGKLSELRARFNAVASKGAPAWRFVNDRQHWTVRNATDQGFPLRGEWRIKFSKEIARLESGIRCWRAEDGRTLELEIAVTGQANQARIYWMRLDDQKFDLAKSQAVGLEADGKFHTVKVDLGASKEYRGLIVGFAVEPAAEPRPGDEWAFRSMVLKNGDK